MSSVLILREEILSLIVLLILYYYKKGIRRSIRGASYAWIWIFAFIHVVFDSVTVISVNLQQWVPDSINLLLHYCYTTSAIWFCFEVCVYTASLTLPIGYMRKFKLFLVWIPLFYMMSAWAFPITYVKGDGTWYSFGPFIFYAFAVAFLLMLIAAGTVFFNRKHISPSVMRMFVVTILNLFVVAILQAYETEWLFTGATCTIITLGIFFGMENPLHMYEERAYIDMNSGLKNRNCYIDESLELDRRYMRNHTARVGVIYGDMNHLKQVNDNYGHAAGDAMIRTVGMVLSKHLSGAYNVYRMGGDEFLAIYINPVPIIIEHEMQSVHEELKNISATQEVPISISMGYYESDRSTETIQEIVDHADEMMYQIKKRQASE